MFSGLPGRPGASAPAAEPGEVAAYGFGPFRLLPRERLLRRGDRVLPLPPKSFDTLLLLVEQPGHLLLKEDLMKALWPDSFVEEVNLAARISQLRKLLGDTGPEPAYIQTVPKQGYRFLPAVTRIWTSPPAPTPPPEAAGAPEKAVRFIALPFEYVPGDERAAYLAHGIPESIAASLAGLRGLVVRSSLLAARLAEARPDPRHIAQEAEVDMLLTGNIMCDGDQVRVRTELVQAPSGTLVASYSCQSGRDRLFEVQDNLVHRILEQLTVRLTPRELRMLRHDVPASARAYEYYLRAGHVERQRTVENISLARDLYRECVEADPDYAPAWARLGRCYRFLEKFGEEGPQNLELAQWAFHRAFALNADLAMAHNLYTQIEADLGRAQEAMARLLRHAETHANDPELFAGLVQACRFCGLMDESVRAHERARRLDSRSVTSVEHTFFLMGEYERALEWYRPKAGYYLDAAMLACTGREEEALRLLRQRDYSGVRSGWMRAMVAALRAALEGDVAASSDIARHALAQQAKDPEGRFYLVRQLARNGEKAEALAHIRSLIGEGFSCSRTLLIDPWLKPLGALAGFDEVLGLAREREAAARAVFEACGGEQVLG